MSKSHPFAHIFSVNPVFRGLGEATWEALAALCVPHSLKRKEVLFLEGDPGDALYVVRRGQIRISVSNEEGHSLTLSLLGPGDVFGEVALLDGQSRSADAVAVEPSDLLMLRRRDFLDLLQSRPALEVRFVKLLCERIRLMNRRIEESMMQPLPVRLARRLLALAEDYGSEMHVSQDELAVLVGSTRESVNRQLQAWRRQGTLDVGRNLIRVLDQTALRHTA